MTTLSDKSLVKLYMRVWDDPGWRTKSEEADIAGEMRAVIDAETDEEALAIVAWWGKYEDPAWIRKHRRLVARARRIAARVEARKKDRAKR